VRAAALAIVGAVALAACGDGKTTTVTEKGSVENRDACKKLVESGKSGKCELDGGTASLAIPGEVARTRGLAAELLDLEVTDTISGEFGNATARGSFVVARVALTNLTNGPQDLSVATDQTLLQLGDNSYSEDFSAANGLEDSFVSQSVTIQPDERLEGTYVYDIPAPPAAKLRRKPIGSVVIGEFGGTPDSSKELVVLRLSGKPSKE
jgi:hypothetical protein